MPRMSRAYCRKTPVSKMGFSQKSSCKAQGLIKRTGKKNKGKYIRSPKYYKHKVKSPLFYKRKKSISRRTGKSNPRVPRKTKKENIKHSSDLFTDENPKGTVHGLKFVNAKEARKSVKRLRSLYKRKKITFAHMRQIVTTMEQRSRYHSHPTKDIKAGNKVWKSFNRSFKKTKV
jgi:hypothetical protein